MERRLYVGPALKRMRRKLGLTQADMAADLDVSASYVALLERNQRPLSGEVLMRLARTYKLEMASLVDRNGVEDETRLAQVLTDPIFAGIDLPPLETADVVTNFPGLVEALLRLHTAYREDQLALADRSAAAEGAEDARAPAVDPVAEARRFLAARGNHFPALDEAAERLARTVDEAGGLAGHIRARHGLNVRLLPSRVMVDSLRRLERHRREIVIDDGLDAASRSFHLAVQLAHLELSEPMEAALAGAGFASEDGRGLARGALASYAAAAVLMPYAAFAGAAEARRYDLEALGRQFGVSFEQVAHRLTTLQKPGQEGVPFFFIRVDPAGNVSKRLDGAGFPFARHGGGCPLWSVHHVFRTPREIQVQWLELPEGSRFFSIARTVTAGGGGYGSPRVERAIALGCAAEHAHRLVYAQAPDSASWGPSQAAFTPIGVTCRLCQRTQCMARSAPPIGRTLLPDTLKRTRAPFGVVDS